MEDSPLLADWRSFGRSRTIRRIVVPNEPHPELLLITDTEQVAAHSEALCKALSHSLRAEILTLLTERAEPMSPNQMRLIFRVPVGDVSYHCKQLVKYECAEEVETRQRRGATEHFYRATRAPNISTSVWKLMSPPVREAFSRHIFEKIAGDALRAFKEGTIDARDDRFMVRMPMTVDEQGWSELSELWNTAFRNALEIKVRSEERLNQGGGKPIKISASLLSFEMP